MEIYSDGSPQDTNWGVGVGDSDWIQGGFCLSLLPAIEPIIAYMHVCNPRISTGFFATLYHIYV